MRWNTLDISSEIWHLIAVGRAVLVILTEVLQLASACPPVSTEASAQIDQLYSDEIAVDDSRFQNCHDYDLSCCSVISITDVCS